MRFFSLFIFFFCQNLLFAQPFIKAFAAGAANLQFSALDKYPDKGWVSAGVAREGSEFFSFVSRFAPSGNLLWSKKPDYYREMRAVVTLDNGDVLVFNNNSGFTQYFDASVLHLDAAGNFKNEVVWGTPDDQDDWYDARKMPDGSVVAVGISRLSNSFIQRVMLARFSNTGQILWEKMYDATELLAFRKIIPLASGGFFMLGDTYDFANRGLLVARCSDDGDILWSKEYTRQVESYTVLGGVSLANDDIMLAVYRFLNASSETNVLRISGDGIVGSQTRLSNGQGLASFGMGMLGNDTLALALVSTSTIFPPTDGDLVLATLATNGDLTGSLAFGSDSQEFGSDAIFDNGEVILCGFQDTSSDGTARRALISKANPRYSCCKKNIQVDQLPPDNLPVANDYAFALTQNTVRQNITVNLPDLAFTEETTCQSFEETPFLPADTAICTGETLELKPEINIPGDLLWSTGASTPAIAVNSPGTYTLTINSECGILTDTVEVLSKGTVPDIVVSPDTAVCKGTEAVLSVSGGASYQWQDETGSILSDDNFLAVRPENAAVYNVTVFIGDCSDTARVAVDVLAPPVVSTTSDLLVPQGVPVNLNATGATTYQWQPATGLSCADCPDPVATLDETTTYIVIGINAEGCPDTASVTVAVKKPCPVYIPNVFAPGSSTATDNNYFSIYGTDINPDGFMLRIYSRWGELVFESFDAAAYWDGLAKGRPAEPGVYTYQLEMITCDGPVRKTGDITLVR